METDQWLDKDFFEPATICANFSADFAESDPMNIYEYLLAFGMYKPNRQTNGIFKELKEADIWVRVQKIYDKYRKKWKGPDIPIYIFPIQTGGLFSGRRHMKKSGVSFNDKMFLFLAPLEDEKELEALIVHEYHHICRMNKQSKKIQEYTLLDSMVMEGLAENAVAEECGPEYLAKWSTLYSERDLLRYWDRSIKKNLDCTRNNRIHDEILFGQKQYPSMIGYAIGYDRVLQFKKIRSLSMKDSFRLPAEEFLLAEESN